MRLPYRSIDPSSFANEEDRAILERVTKRRGGAENILDLDKALLQSPPIADGWNSLFGAIRTGSTLPAQVTEMMICRIAILNKARYEWLQHAPLLDKATGSNKMSGMLKEFDDSSSSKSGWTSKDLAILKYVDEMTKNVQVEQTTFDELHKHFNEREVVEITATIAGYNCVSRFLVALDIGEQNGKEI